MAYQGYFKPKNPKKYKGDPTNIVYRSGWELKLMLFLDERPDVIQWSSEELRIPYISPIDGKRHTYFPDFWIKKADGTVTIVEVKPAFQTTEPKKQSKITKKYIREVTEYGKNQAKWKAADEYCKDRGWKFQIFTEQELGIK